MDDPEIRTLAPLPTVAVRVTAPMTEVDIGTLVNAHLPGVAARLPALGLAIAGPPYVRYHQWGGKLADVELGFPVAGPADRVPALGDRAPGEPGSATLPGGPAAVLVHAGPYRDLPAAHRRLQAWCVARGVVAAGSPWESYVDNPDDVAPEALRTEVVVPLAGGA